MRTVPLQADSPTSTAADRGAVAMLDELAARLDAADKPDGFPERSPASRRPGHLRVRRLAALSVAAAAVLDALDDGRLTDADLVAYFVRQPKR